nr:MAG: hypothetical protein [Lokiarchaeota virus Skoll Meg22_1214]
MNEIEVKPMLKFTEHGYERIDVEGEDVIYSRVYRKCMLQCLPGEKKCSKCVYASSGSGEYNPGPFREEFRFKNMRRNFFIWYHYNKRF